MVAAGEGGRRRKATTQTTQQEEPQRHLLDPAKHNRRQPSPSPKIRLHTVQRLKLQDYLHPCTLPSRLRRPRHWQQCPKKHLAYGPMFNRTRCVLAALTALLPPYPKTHLV